MIELWGQISLKPRGQHYCSPTDISIVIQIRNFQVSVFMNKLLLKVENGMCWGISNGTHLEFLLI